NGCADRRPSSAMSAGRSGGEGCVGVHGDLLLTPGRSEPATVVGCLGAVELFSTVVSLQLGVHIGQQNMSMDELRALWRRFDDAGLDWISVWDLLSEAPPAGGTLAHHEAVATAATLAADTTPARVGWLVFYVGYRNPGLLAK